MFWKNKGHSIDRCFICRFNTPLKLTISIMKFVKNIFVILTSSLPTRMAINLFETNRQMVSEIKCKQNIFVFKKFLAFESWINDLQMWFKVCFLHSRQKSRPSVGTLKHRLTKPLPLPHKQLCWWYFSSNREV